MLLNKTFYQGQSLTIGVLISDTYDIANLQSSAIIIGEKKIASTVINQMLRFELSSEDTRNFITSKTVNLVIDDSYFGRREYTLGSLSFEKTKGQTIDTSIDEGYTVVFNATINEVAISIDSIMYDYVKGSAGSLSSVTASVDSNVGTPEVTVTYDGENADFAFKNLKGDKGDKGEQGEKGDDAVLPAGTVIDPNYVHTDNNYTDEDKAKVDGAIQTETSHTALLDKNAELTNQHLDTTTEKITPIDADSFGLWDSVTSTLKRLSVANMLTWFRGLPHTFTQLITFSGGVKTSEVKLINGGSYVKENGGTIYHTIPWISAGTVTIVAGTSAFSGDGTAFTSAMVGAKLIINGEERIIASVSGQNGTINGLWNGSFSGAFEVRSNLISFDGTEYSIRSYNGAVLSFNANSFIFGSGFAISGLAFGYSNGQEMAFANNGYIAWGSSGYTSSKDTCLKRSSAGVIEINNGTAGQYRDLKLRSVQVTDNTAAASITTVGMTRYRADANNSYTEMCMQTGSNTYAWVIIKQNTW